MKGCNLFNFLLHYFSSDFSMIVEIVRKTKASTSVKNTIKYNSCTNCIKIFIFWKS